MVFRTNSLPFSKLPEHSIVGRATSRQEIRVEEAYKNLPPDSCSGRRRPILAGRPDFRSAFA